MNWTELSIIINHEAVELATNILEIMDQMVS